jgi:hypothetical protein
MAFREKHRRAAMVKRVEQGRAIKSDPDNPVYRALKRSQASRKAAATRRANAVKAQEFPKKNWSTDAKEK